MDRRRTRFTALIAATSLTLLSACAGNDSTGDTDGSAASTTLPSNPDAPAALQFSAPVVGGGTIDFSHYAGQTVALWFWAPT